MSRPNYEDSVAGEIDYCVCVGCPICDPFYDDERGTLL